MNQKESHSYQDVDYTFLAQCAKETDSVADAILRYEKHKSIHINLNMIDLLKPGIEKIINSK